MAQEIIESYLFYLQEMSRKITMRSGMENVLYRRPAKHPSYYKIYNGGARDTDPDFTRHLAIVAQKLNQESGRRLFLGIGLVVGVFKKDGKKRKIATPLVFLPIDIEEERKIEIEFDWESVSINYDLVTLILGKNNDTEASELDAKPTQAEQEYNYKVFNNIEAEFDKHITNPERYFFDTTFPESILNRIANELKEFKRIEISKEDYNATMLEDLIQESLINGNKSLTLFSHRFLFMWNIPDQVSTYEALKQLMKQL